ncbi:MAG: pyridoxal-phosphate dependent enzyme [Bacteroidota bacterium]
MELFNQELDFPFLRDNKISLAVKREDTIHPVISGNKYRKLKYNLSEAKKQGHHTVLSFGGAYSNHIAALAYAGKEYNFRTIGVIRGEELAQRWQDNPTLKSAEHNGMQLHFLSREDYRQKEKSTVLSQLSDQFGGFYLLPEGGTNLLAVKGCEEILTAKDAYFDIICSCVGTGGTLAGLINSAQRQQQVLGFPVLKGMFVKDTIRNFARKENWDLVADFHFGGYAKINAQLVQFMNHFKEKTGIQLDPVYTGKLFFGLFQIIKRNRFKPGTRILAIHTGGLQGISGMNAVLKKKNLPLIH